ncbi:hypothetical protein Hanom_Chr07g00580691 [Helianthus anomalus]
MGQNGFGLERVRVKTGQLKKGLFWFGLERVRVGTGSGQNGFGLKRVRVRTGFGSGRVSFVKKCFFFFFKKRDCISRF